MLNLVLTESAIELVPSDLWKHPAVMKRSRLIGKNPGQMLLDRSYHHGAMLQIKDGRKRGRPDMVIAKFTKAILNNEAIEIYGDVAVPLLGRSLS